MGAAFVLGALAASAVGHAGEAGLSAAEVGKVDELVKNQMAAAKIPGMSVAIVTGMQLQWAKGYGMADLENSVPATADTSYRLASISKTIIAAAVMQLVEEGKLDLDAPIQRYAPTFPKKKWPVTARLLLGHTGGIRTYKRGEKDSTQFYPTLTEALTVFQKDPLEYQPGTSYQYSTEGYVLLAVAVEGASGMNYYEYVRTHIFEPSGVTSMVHDSVFALIPHRTQGYKKLKSGELVNSALADTSSKPVICSNVADLARYAIAFLSGKLVKPSTMEEMFKIYPVTARDMPGGVPFGYSMGWNVAPRRDNHELEVWKAGNQQRVTGLLYLRPESRFALAMLCNLEDAPLTVHFARQIFAAVTKDRKPV